MFHFKNRMESRYGIYIQQHHLDSIRHQIKCGCEILEKQSNNKIVYLVILENKKIPIIWDCSRKVPITCLLEEWIEEDNIDNLPINSL